MSAALGIASSLWWRAVEINCRTGILMRAIGWRSCFSDRVARVLHCGHGSGFHVGKFTEHI